MSRRRTFYTDSSLNLGKDNHVMSWNTNLNIYRVNRFKGFDLEEIEKREQLFDFIEALLMNNMVHVVEAIFGYVGLESTIECLLVNKLWHEFITNHLFKRWAEQAIARDTSLQELADRESWTPYLFLKPEEVPKNLVCYILFYFLY